MAPLTCLEKQKQEAAAALLAEQERIKRAQAYLGAAAGQKEETAAEQLQLARERAIRAQQVEYREHAQQVAHVKTKEKKNRIVLQREEQEAREALEKVREADLLIDRRESVRKQKEDILQKKASATTVREHHVATLKVRSEFNPYAEDMRRESVELSKNYATTGKRYVTGSAIA